MKSTLKTLAAAGDQLDMTALTAVVGGKGKRPGYSSKSIEVRDHDGIYIPIERPDAD